MVRNILKGVSYWVHRLSILPIFIALGLGSRYRDLIAYFSIAILSKAVNLHCIYLK